MKLINDDCLKAMMELPDNSVDTIITDPPYGLGFMGKQWDTFKSDYISKHNNSLTKDLERRPRKDGRNVPGTGIAMRAGLYDQSVKGHIGYQEWFRPIFAELLRIAKPGATLLCFGGTRTYHRIACACEEAGWQIRDCIMWVYGSGFPKSLNIGKAVDKLQGNERKEYLQPIAYPDSDCWSIPNKNSKQPQWGVGSMEEHKNQDGKGNVIKTKGSSEWEGYGTALKPAHEPILIAMKPLDGTFAQNAKKWGVGGLNIDASRIPINSDVDDKRLGGQGEWKTDKTAKNVYEGGYVGNNIKSSEKGRFPANVILDEESAEMLDKQCPKTSKGYAKATDGKVKGQGSLFKQGGVNANRYDMGGLGASRFFYCAKASKAERNRGCEELPKQAMSELDKIGGSKCGMKTGSGNDRDNTYHNNHPTVKPLKLMEYLCILTRTPTGGIVLDPFMGSGTTGMACVNTKRDFIGIEKEKEYFEIAKKRINDTKDHRSKQISWC